MAKNLNTQPFYKELYLDLKNEYGIDNVLISLTLGFLVASVYLKGCKK